jgi:hypothetical protein
LKVIEEELLYIEGKLMEIFHEMQEEKITAPSIFFGFFSVIMTLAAKADMKPKLFESILKSAIKEYKTWPKNKG